MAQRRRPATASTATSSAQSPSSRNRNPSKEARRSRTAAAAVARATRTANAQLSSAAWPKAVRVAALGRAAIAVAALREAQRDGIGGEDHKSAWRALVIACGDAHHKVTLAALEACCAGLDAGRRTSRVLLASIPDRPFGVSSSLGLLVTRCCSRLADGRAPVDERRATVSMVLAEPLRQELCYTRRRRRRTP